MGMELYASSPVAKEVWDRADKHFMDNYGEHTPSFSNSY
jgi:fatty acid synthase subunit beta